MWPDHDNTARLLERAREGDSEAENQLLARHRDALRRVVALRLDPAIAGRIDASDIVQEALVEASRRLPQYMADPAMPFHLWLRQLAKDHLIDAHRKHRVAQKRSVDRERSLTDPIASDSSSIALLQQLAAEGLTPQAAAMRKEIQARFRGALDELKETDREVLLMRHFEQLTNQEVATALDLSEPAAAMRYMRAIRRLGELIGGDGDASGGRESGAE